MTHTQHLLFPTDVCGGRDVPNAHKILQATFMILTRLDDHVVALPEPASFASQPIIHFRLDCSVIVAITSRTLNDVFWQLIDVRVPYFVQQPGVLEFA